MSICNISAFRWVLATCLILGLGVQTSGAQSKAPSVHFAIENPADLTKDEAQRIYEDLKDRLDKGFASSRLDILKSYQDWPKFNDAPYVSATHGQRFVNNYANKLAHNYGTLKDGEKLPAGSVLAKDSVTITDEGHTYPGALFVMEKLPVGQNPDTADWRYIMVLPDGALFGDTTGDRQKAVAYCHTCHEAAASRDFTFFVPEEYQVEN